MFVITVSSKLYLHQKRNVTEVVFIWMKVVSVIQRHQRYYLNTSELLTYFRYSPCLVAHVTYVIGWLSNHRLGQNQPFFFDHVCLHKPLLSLTFVAAFQNGERIGATSSKNTHLHGGIQSAIFSKPQTNENRQHISCRTTIHQSTHSTKPTKPILSSL